MTYQRNTCSTSQKDVLDETLEDLVGRVEVDADDDARDEDDDGPLDHLRLRRPFDLLQLAPRLGGEPPAARARHAARARLALDRVDRPDLRLALPRSLRDARGLLLRLPAGP